MGVPLFFHPFIDGISLIKHIYIYISLYIYIIIIYIYMIIYDYIWLYMIIYDYIWLYMIIYDYIWLYMIIYDYIWLHIYLYMFWYINLLLSGYFSGPAMVRASAPTPGYPPGYQPQVPHGWMVAKSPVGRWAGSWSNPLFRPNRCRIW